MRNLNMSLSCGPRPAAVVGATSRPRLFPAFASNLLRKYIPKNLLVSHNRAASVCHAVAKRGPKPKADAPEDDDAELQPSDLAAAPYQQTLNRSFTLGGVGLHSGDYAWVRVRPAFAGDGRYFVRVPEGTNAHLFDPDAQAAEQHVEQLSQDDPEIRDKRLLAFMQFIRAQEDGYVGSFEDYCIDTGCFYEIGGFPEPVVQDEVEAPVRKDTTHDVIIDAHADNIQSVSPYCTVLDMGSGGTGDSDARSSETHVASVEHLLATLEALHVDNARIEIEGGNEIPVLDGSAQGWVEAIADVGIRPAFTPASDDLVRKFAWRPTQPISVYDGDAFISLFPAGIDFQLSAGLNNPVPAVGQQWLTINALSTQELNYAMDISPARTWVESAQAAYAMKDLGYLRAGTVGCVMVGKGNDWLTSADVRFLGDEPVRHNIIDVIGDLALLGKDGNSGLLMGHVVAFNTNHHLQREFVKAVQSAIDEGNMELTPFMLTPDDAEAILQQLRKLTGDDDDKEADVDDEVDEDFEDEEE